MQKQTQKIEVEFILGKKDTIYRYMNTVPTVGDILLFNKCRYLVKSRLIDIDQTKSPIYDFEEQISLYCEEI